MEKNFDEKNLNRQRSTGRNKLKSRYPKKPLRRPINFWKLLYRPMNPHYRSKHRSKSK